MPQSCQALNDLMFKLLSPKLFSLLYVSEILARSCSASSTISENSERFALQMVCEMELQVHKTIRHLIC
ncbi:unnamed protein product [Arabis nemorensis]|uniref:Uncharacterized protein n=1 Tax=Arabis nemorensis TaxID=586526 RepID=A0A565B1U3_9BRAS|nr:unnamed protein product [Arabis nemorensis]